MTKKHSTKKALLASALSLLLCVSMLVGTTFAWFTDSVTSGRNTIQSGNLDVVLEYWDGDSYEEVTSTTKLFDDAALWEPGYTEVAYLKVSNAGSLALKYQLAVNVYNEVLGKTEVGADIKLSDYLQFKVVESDTDLADTYTRETAQNADAVATKLQTYNSEIKTLEPKNEQGDNNYYDYVALIIYMPTTVGNEANHDGENIPSIEMGVNLFATQFTYEEDSFGKDYDEDAVYTDVTVANAAELETAINTGNKIIGIQGTITLTKSLGATGVTFVGTTGDAVIDFMTYGISGIGNTFVGLTLDNDRNGYYNGMQYSDAENTTYKNCVIANGVTTYGNSTFVGCTFNELPAGNYALWFYDGVNFVVEDCVFNYGNRAIKIFSDGPLDMTVTIRNCSFKVSETSVASKAMIEIDDTHMRSANVTVSGITIDSAIVAQGVYRIDDGELNTSTDKSVVSVDGVVTSKKVNSQTGLTDALTGTDDVAIDLSEGEYKMPSFESGKEVTISGTKNAIIDLTMGAYMENSTVSFEGVTIKGSTGMANGNGSDYAALYTPNVTYTDCTFDGPFRIGRDGATFIGCTFTNLGNDYVWTYGNDCIFIGCTFESDGKALLIYNDGGDEVAKVTVKDCVFNATNGAKAGAIANQNCAAIEIDNFGHGVDLTTSGNTYSEHFSGEWRIKSHNGTANDVLVNGVEYTTIAIDGKLMTIDANKNVTVQ